MNIILTKYIFPIPERIVISEKLKFSLDNPRNSNEVAIIKKHIEKSLNSPNEVYEGNPQFRLPIYSSEETEDILTVESSLKNLEKKFSTKDSYLKSFFEDHKEDDILDLLAKMWIIARYDDEGEREALTKRSEELNKDGRGGVFFILNEKNPILTNSNNLVSFSYLLSLLCHSDKEFYHGKSFILHHYEHDLELPKIDATLNYSIFSLGFIAYSGDSINEEDDWESFFHVRERIKKISKNLDDIIEDDNKDKIIFIANQLKVIGHDIKNERLRLVTLVSIIELLLTHSPDYRRFNIEDSISKQFRLKASVLIYQNGISKDLNWIKNKLKEIYNQRSNIAHGNFKSLEKYFEKEIKNSKEDDLDEVIILERLNGEIFKFIRAILEEYIKDRKFVEFLKEN